MKAYQLMSRKASYYQNHFLPTICNQIFNLDKPDMWSKGDIIPFPKVSNLCLSTNYRGITHTCISAKIYNKMILNRILPFKDPLLDPNQNVFRRGFPPYHK